MSYCSAVTAVKLIPTTTSPASQVAHLLALLENLPRRRGAREVHQLRTSVRRLEVQLGPISPRLAHLLKRLRRQAGRVRDLDVHLALLASASLARTAGAHILQAVLQRQRRRQARRLCQLATRSARRLQPELSAAAMHAVAGSFSSSQADLARRDCRQQFLALTREIPAAGAPLHALRIATKKLRYSLEPFASQAKVAPLLTEFKRVQDAIGLWHDWDTLAPFAERWLKPTLAAPLHAEFACQAAHQLRLARRLVAEVHRELAKQVKPAARQRRRTLTCLPTVATLSSRPRPADRRKAS